MAKTVSRTMSMRARFMGMRDPDVDLPRTPVRVAADTQAKALDINTVKKFEFGGHDRAVLLPERPRTSGGQPSQSSFRRADSKRGKDDLYVNPLAMHGRGTTFYDFDLPNSTPTVNSKPLESSLPATRNPSLAQHPTSPREMTSQQANMVVPEMEIGMALGSPSHQPIDWPQKLQTEDTRTPSPHITSNSLASSVVPVVKQRKSKWGVFGGMFGGKKDVESQQQPFYQLQPEPSPQPTATVATKFGTNKYHNFSGPSPPVEEKPTGRRRGQSISTRQAKTKTPKADMKRANTLPVRQFLQKDSSQETPIITLEGDSLGPKLDVDIPSIQMERYSIMFGSVLQKPSNHSTSILARRQAAPDKSKMANIALASKEQELQQRKERLMPRRATSPQPTKSPAFSLFPNTPSKQFHREPSPSKSRFGASGSLQRSNTSPAALSPSQPTFDSGPANGAHSKLGNTAFPIGVTPSNPNESPNIPLSGTMKQSRPSSAGRSPSKGKGMNNFWTLEESHLNLSSPDSVDDADYTYGLSPIHDPQPLKPKLIEPEFEIVNRQIQQNIPTISPATASSNGSDHSTFTSTSSSAASVSTAATSISVPIMLRTSTTAKSFQAEPHLPPSSSSRTRRSDSTASAIPLEEGEARLKNAAELSIARQISISQQQRELLVPRNTIPKTSDASVTSNKKDDSNSQSPIKHTAPAIELARTANPLGAVAEVAKQERQKPVMNRLNTSPVFERVSVVNAQKANTPTLVVVPGPRDSECVKTWDGNTIALPIVHPGVGNLSIAERRKGMEVGEIKVGLSVRRREGRRVAERAKEGAREERRIQHRQRTSERVIVESISVASN